MAALNREIEMKDIEIRLHEQKMRALKEGNSKVRAIALTGPRPLLAITNGSETTEPPQALGLVDEFQRV